MSEPKFWVVWQPGSGEPHRRHASLEVAQAEAERLAECAPRKAFYVLEGVSRSQKVSVITEPLIPEVDDLPF